MLFALLLQELFLETVKFARPTILILFTFHSRGIKWMGKKENDLSLFYMMSSKIFSKISSTFKTELLWIHSRMLHVLAFPLKQMQVITPPSVVYMVICVCPRLLSRLVGVWHSTTSELPYTSHYLRARNVWHASNSHSARMAEKYASCSQRYSLDWVEQKLGLHYDDEDLQHWADILGEGIFWLEFTAFLSTSRAEAQEKSTTLDITTRFPVLAPMAWSTSGAMQRHFGSKEKHFSFCGASLDTLFSWWINNKVSFNTNPLLVPEFARVLISRALLQHVASRVGIFLKDIL